MKKVGSMSKKKDEEDREEKGEYKSVKKEDFIFPDLKTAYMYWRNFLPDNTYHEHVAKRNCVNIGCSLLHKESINCNDTAKKKVYEDLVKKGREALKTAIPLKRGTNFLAQDIASKKHVVYKMTADDAGESHSKENEYFDAEKNFRDQQYEACIRKLEEVDAEIQDRLTETDIISSDEPPLDELMVRLMRIRFRGKINEYIGRMKEDATST